MFLNTLHNIVAILRTMAVRKIKGSWWVDFQIRQRRYRYRSPENSKLGALEYEAVLRQKLARGELLETTFTKPQTFREFSAGWYKTYAIPNNKPSEQRNKRIALDKHLIPWFADMPLKNIGVSDIERFKQEKIQSGLSAKSINNVLCILSRCLGCATEWEQLEHKPKIKPLCSASIVRLLVARRIDTPDQRM